MDLKFEDVFGEKLKLLISTDALDLARNYGVANKDICAIKDNTLGFSNFPFVLQYDGMISEGAVARYTSYSQAISWFNEKDISVVRDSSKGIKTKRELVYRVDDVDFGYRADEMQNNYAKTSKLTLVEINDDAACSSGKLTYKTTGKKYILETTRAESQPISTSASKKTNDYICADFVTKTMQFLRNSGRSVSKADVINYCICITQGFITTLAGAPGTGKTTLCRLLAKAMGLREETGDYNENARYAEISVERGWTSLKDFIGYPNPFPSADNNKKKDKGNQDDAIIASNIDACNAFRRMNSKWQDETPDAPPYLMLLDEANLSPIEYYWAQFLRNCQLDDDEESGEDGSAAKRKINISPKDAWRISPNLRFLATVNFDHTTEELSPRFLDRSWVITLKSPEEILPRNKQPLPEPVPLRELQELFGFPVEGEKFPAAVKSIWTQIQDAFRDDNVKMPLSPRNIIAVENYCIAASRFREDEITPKKALDFAVLQKILPIISGYGDRCETLIQKLTDIAKTNGLDCTHEKLEEMSAGAAANSGFYQFFVR